MGFKYVYHVRQHGYPLAVSLTVTNNLQGKVEAFLQAGCIDNAQHMVYTRIIQCVRDPVDTCLSCYVQNFTLPLRFSKRSPKFEVSNANELDALIATVRSALDASDTTKLEVGGHTSHEGNKQFNRDLGRLRAEVGRDLLVGKGVPSARLVIKSYGPDKPAAPHDGGEGSAACWRVTVRLIE